MSPMLWGQPVHLQSPCRTHSQQTAVLGHAPADLTLGLVILPLTLLRLLLRVPKAFCQLQLGTTHLHSRLGPGTAAIMQPPGQSGLSRLASTSANRSTRVAMRSTRCLTDGMIALCAGRTHNSSSNLRSSTATCTVGPDLMDRIFRTSAYVKTVA